MKQLLGNGLRQRQQQPQNVAQSLPRALSAAACPGDNCFRPFSLPLHVQDMQGPEAHQFVAEVKKSPVS